MSVSSGHGPAEGADCIETIERLYHFLDGELSEQLRVKIALHVEECPPCGEIVAFEIHLRRLVAARCQENLPDELRERVAKALMSARSDDAGDH